MNMNFSHTVSVLVFVLHSRYMSIDWAIRIHPHGRVLIMSSGFFVRKTNFCLMGFNLIFCLRDNLNERLHVRGVGMRLLI